jgi:exopolysaccharide biosynthesis protein
MVSAPASAAPTPSSVSSLPAMPVAHSNGSVPAPAVPAPAVPIPASSFGLFIDSPGSYTVKAMAVADGMVPSDIMLKRLQVFALMDPPVIRITDSSSSNSGSSGSSGSDNDGDDDNGRRYDIPLNLSLANPSVCSVDHLDLVACFRVTKNGVEHPAFCQSCGQAVVLDNIGNYILSVYFSIDGLVISKERKLKYTLTRPQFDTKSVYFRKDMPFQFKPKVDIFTVSKELNDRYGCSKRNIRGHHIVLHNPLGHFNILPPAGGCGKGLSLPSESSRKFSNSFQEQNDGSNSSSSGNNFFQNPTYKRMIDQLSKEDIAEWRRQHAAARSQRAAMSSCTVTTNAGFFDVNNFNCLGNLVSEGKMIQTSANHNVNFGIRNGSFYIGYIDVKPKSKSKSSESLHPEDNFDTLISGLVWLVRDGRPYVLQSASPAAGTGMNGDDENMTIQSNGPNFVNILSARTAIGYDVFGRLMILQVEGESFIRGMNLHEFADFLVELGFESAINLDGGGSATITAFNTLITEPSWTCTPADEAATEKAEDDDITIPSTAAAAAESFRVCEKPVSSITCIHPMPPPDDSMLLPSQLEQGERETGGGMLVSPSVAPIKGGNTGTSIGDTTSSSGGSEGGSKGGGKEAGEGGGVAADPPADLTDYTAVYIDSIKHELKVYQYCSFGFAILLVISLTANAWWVISYNALKKQLNDKGSSKGSSKGSNRDSPLAPASAARGGVTVREIELSSHSRTLDRARDGYTEDYEYGLDNLDDFEANGPLEPFDPLDGSDEGSDENDSYDDEAVLMSPHSRKTQAIQGGLGVGYNPFQRR